ncbi:antibiotic biosynthesis monooxygenase [Ancylobacter sp. Lp-2]|uniref:antibiotic biosynthesis monooxygenase n=1 Tax=Ancylobacter sp. Lp-2 TaxID=2881339 RepID=UPI001E57D95D|nr:antibiotic biosynthesis monooxygenase [Ancylobacter sp. Lp-2]MCB4770427.1 antibiotic biosynthesis monooxygenase [Ancylobacter sp. Lp-2]
MSAATDDARVSAVVSRVHLDDHRHGQFPSWHAAVTRLIAGQPGFLSVEILPAHAESAEWQVVQRFASHEALASWLAHAERRALFADFTATDARDAGEPFEEAAPDYHAFGTVTEVITTEVEPGREGEFLAWAEAAQTAQARFPGYMGTFVQAPIFGDPPFWTALVRFQSPAQLDAWLISAERKALTDGADPTVSHWSTRRLAPGFGSWFAPDGTGTVPPAWKQTALVLLVLFPVVILEMIFLSPHLTGLPTTLAVFIGNAISVSLVSWPLVGIARSALKWWLTPSAAHRRQAEIGGALLLIALYAAEIGLLSLLF